MSISKQILKIVGDKTPTSDPVNQDCGFCGEPCSGGGVEIKKVFSNSTFNLTQDMKNPKGTHICNYCNVFFSVENWKAYCERNDKDPHFPRVEGKPATLANWVFFSHYFAKNDHRIVKNRQDWRDYLTNPPEPPFCFVISTICKKHLIFKSIMAHDKACFPIRFEDEILYIRPELFKNCLDNFEALYKMGLNKGSIVTGNYSTTALLKVNKEAFLSHEAVISKFRMMNKSYLRVCEFIGGKDD